MLSSIVTKLIDQKEISEFSKQTKAIKNIHVYKDEKELTELIVEQRSFNHAKCLERTYS